MQFATKPVQIGPLKIGDGNFTLIAGPCSLESEEQFETVAHAVKASGASLLRGGMFKLRTRPDTFQGLGREAFEIARRVKTKVSMPFVSEITDPREISDMMEIVDVFQVGSRNMHNYALLKELGKVNKPVLLKRGFSGLIKEWLHSADYIVSGGNDQVILCERGIRTFETSTRNTFDLNAVAYVKQNSSFPIIADPSHGTGETSMVTPLALASAAAGADGLMVEVHPNPSEALSDGFQALNLKQFEQMAERLEKVLSALDKKIVAIV